MHLPAQNQNQTLVEKKDPGIESPFFGLGSKILHLLEVLGSYIIVIIIIILILIKCFL